jgi:hypothetical protein
MDMGQSTQDRPDDSAPDLGDPGKRSDTDPTIWRAPLVPAAPPDSRDERSPPPWRRRPTATRSRLDEATPEEMEAALSREGPRIRRKLAILHCTPIDPDEPRPSARGIQAMLDGSDLEHQGALVAWASELLYRDLSASVPRFDPIGRGWVTEQDLQLPPPRAYRLPSGRLSPQELHEGCRWLDSCLTTLDPFYQDFILAREYDGGSWRHVANIHRRSVPACQRFHSKALKLLHATLQRFSPPTHD